MSNDIIATRVLGLLDHMSLSRVRTIKRRKLTSYSTTVPAKDLYALLDALEEVYPDLLDSYIRIREEG